VRVEVLDLDGGVVTQTKLLECCRPDVVDLREWGPRLRLNSRFRRFDEFEQALALHRSLAPQAPSLVFCGSGDFHHISLALVRRVTEPFNLLVFDNHPDWMRGWPALHCGTWLYHAARLPMVQSVYHVGGDVDFDNYYRRLAPWSLLESGKITVIPAYRTYRAGRWSRVPVTPLRERPDQPARRDRLRTLLHAYLADLARFPLYISLDKDVLRPTAAVVNWDSGRLELTELLDTLNAFVRAANANLAGVDIVGDWSPVSLHGWLQRAFHWTMHPPSQIDSREATRVNERTNLLLLECLQNLLHHEPIREKCA
jgi:arginase family enzyme